MASIPARILECSVCYQRLNDPRTLPCDHIFCRHCITDWLSREKYCPYCREPATLGQLKHSSYILNDILNNIQINDNEKCDGCKDSADILKKCDHCSKYLCASCERQHLEEVRRDIRELCDELISVHGPELDRQEENIVMLMSAAANVKENLIKQLQSAHEALNDQISNLHSRSLETLKRMEDASHPDLNTQIEAVETLIGRISSCVSESIKILEKKGHLLMSQEEETVDEILNSLPFRYRKTHHVGVQIKVCHRRHRRSRYATTKLKIVPTGTDALVCTQSRHYIDHAFAHPQVPCKSDGILNPWIASAYGFNCELVNMDIWQVRGHKIVPHRCTFSDGNDHPNWFMLVKKNPQEAFTRVFIDPFVYHIAALSSARLIRETRLIAA
ncbi:hypothetical protein ACTXT7_016473 [Hymenolepis weldensis]